MITDPPEVLAPVSELYVGSSLLPGAPLGVAVVALTLERKRVMLSLTTDQAAALAAELLDAVTSPRVPDRGAQLRVVPVRVGGDS